MFTLVTNIHTMGTYSVQPLGKSVFAIVNLSPATELSGPGSLMIVDATNPQKPALYPHSTQFGLNGTQAVNGFLLAPSLSGLDIYKIQRP